MSAALMVLISFAFIEVSYGQASFRKHPSASIPGNELRPEPIQSAATHAGVIWTPTQGATHYHIDYAILATDPANSLYGRDVVAQRFVVNDNELMENRHSIEHGLVDADTITVTVIPVFDNGRGSVTWYDNLAQTTTFTAPRLPAASADPQLSEGHLANIATSAESELQPMSSESQLPPMTAACISPALRADVADYAAETWRGAAHVERWLRVMQTFSGTANDATVVTLAETQAYLNQGRQRWQPVRQAIHCLAR